MQIYNIQRSEDLKELTFHGDSNFPVAVYTTDIQQNILGYIPLHWHNELQFVVVLEGQVQFTIDSNTVLLGEGDGLFINANLLHTSTSYDCDNSKYICFDIDASLFLLNNPLLESFGAFILNPERLPYAVLNPSIQWQKNTIEHLKSMYALYTEKSYGFELLFISSLLKICHELITHISADPIVPTLSGNEHQRIKELLSYIHAHFSEKITLDDIASAANISRSECCRFFKKMTQTTPIEYLTSYRINQSIYLLKNSDLTITEIAIEVGFSSASYFIDKFKKHTHYTPKEFQRTFKTVERA